MCEDCAEFYSQIKEKSVPQVFDKYMTQFGWKKSEKYVVQNGFAYENDKYILFFTEKYKVVYDKNLYEIAHWDNTFANSKHTKACVECNQLPSLKEAPKAILKVKIWTAILDSITCEHCKKLNGTGKSLWALFFINIGGKIYSLEGPPLHWVILKSGKKKTTCRCYFEYSTDKGILKRG